MTTDWEQAVNALQGQVVRLEHSLSNIRLTYGAVAGVIGIAVATMGAFSVATYNRLNTISDRVSDTQRDIEGLKKDVGYVQRDLTALTAQVEKLSTIVGTIKDGQLQLTSSIRQLADATEYLRASLEAVAKAVNAPPPKLQRQNFLIPELPPDNSPLQIKDKLPLKDAVQP